MAQRYDNFVDYQLFSFLFVNSQPENAWHLLFCFSPSNTENMTALCSIDFVYR